MIYYHTEHINADLGTQGIDEAIQRGLTALSAEAGQAVILDAIIPVSIGDRAYLVIMAKPYNDPANDLKAVFE